MAGDGGNTYKPSVEPELEVPRSHPDAIDSPYPLEGDSARSAVPTRLLEGQPARICFVVAFVAFTAAAAGWMVSSFLSGWMEIAGMVAVGLFYLGLGLLEVGRRSPT